MASEKSLGRRRRPWWKAEHKSLVPVDGFAIRNLNPDFGIIDDFSPTPKPGVPYISDDEIWFDERFEGELQQQLRVLWHTRFVQHLPEKVMRAWLNARLAERRGPLSKLDLREITAKRPKRKGNLLIRYVKGDLIRRRWDVWFIFGGHDLIYPDYIPENEVWIDIRQDPREAKYTLHHELFERRLMKKGMSYAKAHRLATKSEQKLRSREHDRRRKRRKNRLKPLPVPVFSQADGRSCGTTSLKSVCRFHGKRVSKKTLNALCGLTEDGIDHIPLAKGATKLGAHAFVKAEGTLSELRHFIERGYPVIIGWWSVQPDEAAAGYGPFDPAWDREARAEGDCGHYSVVYHMSEKYVWIMDPQRFMQAGKLVRGGRRRFRIEDFLSAWYDTDGPEYQKVERWYLVVNFDGKTFGKRFKDGKDLLPEEA